MIKKLLVMTALASLAPLSSAGANLLCITDQVSGFHHDSSQDDWRYSTFLPGERYLVTEIDTDRYKVEKLDKDGTWYAGCRRRPDLGADSFTCETGTNAIHFNRKTMRFTAFRYFGYWNGSDDSLSLAIGTCAES